MNELENEYLAFNQDDEVLFAHVRTENLDQINMGAIRQTLEDNLEEVKQGVVNLDLGRVAYAGSVAIGQLIGLHKSLQKHGKELILSNLNKAVREVAKVTKLDNLIKIE